jgi:hypothetical protein
VSYAPAKLLELASLWTSRGGTFLGVVGSWSTHCSGYHLGRDRIFSACACKPGGICKPGLYGADYSVANFPARDGGSHCTNAGMAIDLGPLAGYPGTEVALAKWIIGQCQRGDPDTLDIRGVNYQTLRWDRARGQASAAYVHSVNEAGHIHIEWFRDSELRDKTAIVRRWLAAVFPAPGVITKTVICSGGFLWPSSAGADGAPALAALPAGTVCTILGTVAGHAWSIDCNGATLVGTDWYHITALGLTGYAVTGRFALATAEKTVVCSGGFLWPSSAGADGAPALAALPAGTVCTILGTVAGHAWSIDCNGATLVGTNWYHVTALGLTGYAVTGRF